MSSAQEARSSNPPAASAAEVGRLLASDPAAAEAKAREFLNAVPNDADATLVLAASLRRQAKAADAIAILETFVAAQPDSSFAQIELGLARAQQGDHAGALDALGRAVDFAPTFPQAWQAVGDELTLRDAGHTPEAEDILKAADAALAARNLAEAETLLARCLERWPDFQAARFRHAIVLLSNGKGHLALPVIGSLIERDADNAFYRELMASALYETGHFSQAIAQYEDLLRDECPRPGAWLSYGRALRAIGRVTDSVTAFRRAIALCPEFAEAYRTLATVKTVRLEPAMIDTLRTLLARPGLLAQRSAKLHFALAKALEDAGQFGEAFEHYSRSQHFQRLGMNYKAQSFTNLVQRIKARSTPAHFRARAHLGCMAPDPIFLVGMPRAGSTLVQEILAAHPDVERTGELRDLSALLQQLQQQSPHERLPPFPDLVERIPPERLRAIGEAYLARTRPHRKRGTPRFVDKYCENFLFAGFIHLILPNAKIVDVRRHPVDCGLSCFRNYFPEGPAWAHSLGDIGSYYADYVNLMAHFDETMPGRVHRIIYERLIGNPEKEVRRLLDHVELPFAPECLRFYEKEQAIVTVSVEQARRPIYTEGVGNSRDYDAWVGPLKQALGPALESYPEAPKPFPSLQMSMTMRLS